MSQLKVLITTYHQAYLNKGGGELQLIEVASQLRKLGVMADIYGHNSRELDEYDVVLHFSVHGGAENLLETIKKTGTKIAVWPNIWFDTPDKYPVDIIRHTLETADLILPNSRTELKQLANYFRIPEDRFTVVPCGVDPCFGDPADPDIFRIIYHVDDYILTVGIIEEGKNQLQLIRALSDSKKPLVLVGNYRDKDYYEECKRSAPPHFRFVPFLTPKSEALRSAYQNCSLYVEVPSEPPGQTAIEAALAGAKLVLSEGDWPREYLGNQVTYVNPESGDSIRQGVEDTIGQQEPEDLRQTVRDRYLFPGVLRPLVDSLTKLASR